MNPRPRLFNGLFAIMLVVLVPAAGCTPWKINNVRDRVQPSNYRDWSPQFGDLPFALVTDDGRVVLRNIRNNLYLTENDFVMNYYDKSFALSDIRTVDYCVVPFQGHEYMAHTLLSFAIADGSYIAISAEIRTEKGEEYSPWLGMSNQYELTYVVADERDLIRLRTHHRNAEVYLYPTVATPEQAQALFLDMIRRVNQLAEHPEFYTTIRNNCTTNILKHVNRLRKTPILYNWKILLPGHSAKYAYDLGLLDNSVTFDQLKQSALINDLANQHYNDANFSQAIRSRRLIGSASGTQ